MIKQGAKIVQEWNDVAVELKPADRRRLSEQCRNRLKLNEIQTDETSSDAPSSLFNVEMQGIARAVLQTLKPDAPIGLDQLVDSVTGASPSEIIAALFELELAGLVRQFPGKSFLRVWAG